MKILMIINGPAYGADATYNAVRLAGALAKREDVTMLSIVTRHGGQVGCCGTCMDARGLTQDRLIELAERSTMDELADWTLAADKVLVF